MKDKINLPKRSDTIYQIIEGFREDNKKGFKDYEYTNCIAYEMAIRNDEVITIIEQIKKIIDYVQSEDLEFDIYLFLFSEMNVINLMEREKYEILNNKLKLYGFDYSEYTLLSNTEKRRSSLSASLNMVFSLSKEKINEILKIEYDFIESLKISDKEKVLLRCKVLKEGCKYQEDSKRIIKDYFSKENLKIGGLSLKPELKFDSNVKYDISLNLALPKDELIAYISKLKDEYDKDNSIIKSPLELLGEKLEKAEEMNSKSLPKDKDKRKKSMADAFYIYDVWKILEIDYSEKTKELKAKQEKEIKAIKQNINYDKDDRASLISDIKDRYKMKIKNECSKEMALVPKIAEMLNISEDTVYKLHTIMIKYIDKLKYKELITGQAN